MKKLIVLSLAATLNGCFLQIPEKWLDGQAGQKITLGEEVDGFEDELAAQRRRYKADSSQPSQLLMDLSSGRPRIAATTLLNQKGLEIQATSGCGACHQK